MDHYQFVFEIITEDRKDILIALLDNIGFEGFEEAENELKAFIGIDKFNPDVFDNIIENNHATYSRSIIKETNWNKKWESGFRPVSVIHPSSNVPFVSVRANFHAPVDGIQYDLVITPKMSFGTGHHATTYLVMQQMCLLDFRGKTVIDFGTGTAVLAIFAEKLGASNVIGIDNDDWSINNAKENIVANDCKNISLVKAETIGPAMKADIILANINLNIIIANLAAIKAACNPGTSILFSGILQQDEDQLKEASKKEHFFIKGCFTKDNWLVMLTNA